ncbi:UDP-N-acetylglucosamine--N-acetylmuramyl-(pentapeptide) pyrophosphoryl-undecaprenol N-acetylglucosamine transferase [bacterium]|nr:UDP-N-acetylglucosamine--N-acetylmuramyl-(pentapeptide) pyrophosphoryl-undecaprenol N-acetylglucosamine transferase [bacterium]
MKNYIAFGTGKTGGHLFPAIEMAKEFKDKGFEAVFFIEGTDMEKKVLSKYNFNYIKIFAAPLTSGNVKMMINLFFKNSMGIFKTLSHLILHRPKFTIITGGYGAFPLAFSSLLLFIPLFTYEGNVIMGKVNKIFAPFARVNFSPVLGRFGKFLKSGFIVRKEIANAEFYFSDKLRILITGGSQGSRMILDNVLHMLQAHNEFFIKNNISFLISCGHKNTHYIKLFSEFKNVRAKGFIMDMKNELLNSNIIIGRAGAMTIEENLAIGRFGIYIPLKNSAENHQYHNALKMQKQGVGILIEEDQLNGDLLFNKIKEIVLSKENLYDNSKKAYEIFRTRHKINIINEILRRI